MKVRELIEKLEQFDENFELVFKSCIESGRSVSYVEDGSLELEEDGGEIVLSVSGEESSYD